MTNFFERILGVGYRPAVSPTCFRLPVFFVWMLRHWPELANVGWGISVAVFLFGFQACVFASFWEAGARFVNRFEGQIWIRPPGVSSFEATGLLDERYEWLVHAQPGVSSVKKAIFGFVPWKDDAGRWSNVALIGYSRLPERPGTVFIEAAGATSLGTPLGSSAEAGGRTVFAGGLLEGYSSFLGMPYVLADYRTAREVLTFPTGRTNFLLIELTPGINPQVAVDGLRRLVPELEVVTKARMSFDSSLFWVRKTGAGGAILLAAVLALVVGFVFSFFSVQRFTDRIRRDLVTLLLIGARRSDLSRRIVLYCASLSLITSLLGAIMVVPAMALARVAIPWVHATPGVLVLALMVGVASGALAAWAAARTVAGMDEMEAFRGGH